MDPKKKKWLEDAFEEYCMSEVIFILIILIHYNSLLFL